MRALTLAMMLAAAAASAAGATGTQSSPAGPVAIYPTAQTLPENLLRVYLYFPRRMGQGSILDHIELVDERGRVLDDVFLTNSHDLWSPDRTRLTLLLDPGRVKTGLAAHLALGRALVRGEQYSLIVRGSAVDAGGGTIGADTRYTFTVGPSDLAPPTPDAWDLSVPAAGSSDPLIVDLGSSHDHLSLAYRLRVLSQDGTVIPGAIDLGAEESVWTFTPSQPWSAAPHALSIDPRLEDLAGNRPGVLFDRPQEAHAEDWSTSLPFQPGT